MIRTLPIAAFEWLGTFLVLAVSSSLALKLAERRLSFRIIVLLLCGLFPLIPIGGLNFSQQFLTVVGHISISTDILLSIVLLERVFGVDVNMSRERSTVLGMVVIGGALVFPPTFGLIQFNGYQLGFGPQILTIVIMGLAVVFALSKRNIAFWMLVLCFLSFEMHILASNNLWDYLLDPLLAIYAAGGLLWQAVNAVIAKRRPTFL